MNHKAIARIEDDMYTFLSEASMCGRGELISRQARVQEWLKGEGWRYNLWSKAQDIQADHELDIQHSLYTRMFPANDIDEIPF